MTVIAFIPGTGRMGYGLAWRCARAGHTVLIGSRESSKAQEAADKILKDFPNAKIQAGVCEDLPVSTADIIVWCPAVTIARGLSMLKNYETKFSGKIVLDTTNIIYRIKEEDAEGFYGKCSSTDKNFEVIPTARWVAGFKSVPFADLTLEKPTTPAELYSDDKEAMEEVKLLVEQIDFPLKSTAPLEGARAAEVALMEWAKTNIPAEAIEKARNEV